MKERLHAKCERNTRLSQYLVVDAVFLPPLGDLTILLLSCPAPFRLLFVDAGVRKQRITR